MVFAFLGLSVLEEIQQYNSANSFWYISPCTYIIHQTLSFASLMTEKK